MNLVLQIYLSMLPVDGHYTKCSISNEGVLNGMKIGSPWNLLSTVDALWGDFDTGLAYTFH